MLVDIYDHLSSRAHLADITFLFGSENLQAHKRAPAIVCVPTTDDWAPGKVALKGYDRANRSVGTLGVSAMWRLWGIDGDLQRATSKDHHRAAEVLLRRFLVEVHREFYGAHKVNSIVWLNQDGQALSEFGRAVDVAITFGTPVNELPAEGGVAKATITGTEPTTTPVSP